MEKPRYLVILARILTRLIVPTSGFFVFIAIGIAIPSKTWWVALKAFALTVGFFGVSVISLEALIFSVKIYRDSRFTWRTLKALKYDSLEDMRAAIKARDAFKGSEGDK